jgi:hypothetical protein
MTEKGIRVKGLFLMECSFLKIAISILLKVYFKHNLRIKRSTIQNGAITGLWF